ncbi:MAG: hypothetical protein M1839_002392 [Geoglossum umbratile]|nr:MAG: hypothetical protein M1839_002392 [Geoglossum umbratile]
MSAAYDQMAASLPQFETRRALLILDLQNDFLSVDSKLPIDSRSGFVQNIKALVPVFRGSGDVIWIRSEFETVRPVNDYAGEGETVITDRELPRRPEVGGAGSATGGRSASGRVMPSARVMELLRAASARHDTRFSVERLFLGTETLEQPEEGNETFLSLSSDGTAPVCCIPNTLGSEFAETIVPCIEYSTDSVLTKTYYSAFNSTQLLPSLRGNLVTELFICGVLSNISVYSTALDAARHGYSITILTDCLGYRSEDRHNEAMRQMTELMGAEVISSKDLIEKIKSEQKDGAAMAQKSSRVPVGSAMDKAEFEQLLEGLTLNTGPSATTNIDHISPSVSKEDTATDADQASSAPTEIASPDPETFEAERQGTLISGPSIEVDEDADLDSTELEPIKFFVRADRTLAKVDAEKEQAAKINGVERKIPGRLDREDDSRGQIENASLKSERLPTPTLGVLEAASAALAQVALDPITPASQPESAVPGLTPTNTEVTTTQVTQPRPVGGLAQTKIRSPPVLGPGDVIGEGDSRIVVNILPPELKDTAFDRLKAEVQWKKMQHRGGEVPRLVAVEGEIGDDGRYPIYRHPADESPPLLPFSPTTLSIKKEAEKVLRHPINHVLIQHYRSGQDYISEHSDKTLDIVRGSSIANVSIGAQRTMTLRTKKPAKGDTTTIPTGSIISRDERVGGASSSNAASSPPKPLPTAIPTSSLEAQPRRFETQTRHVQRIPMPHNSMFVLGQATNMHWLHGIRQDKRPPSIKSAEETAFNGERISLTFRHIGTFLDKSTEHIWGQGAQSKSKETAGKVINGNTDEAEEMIKMFGRENHESEFDWDKSYGAGFDVLNIVTKPPSPSNDGVSGAPALGLSTESEGLS